LLYFDTCFARFLHSNDIIHSIFLLLLCRMENHDKRHSVESLIGLQVKLKTTLGEEIEGEIFNYDSSTKCVIVSQQSSHSTIKKSFRILKASFVKEIQYLGRSSSVENLVLPSVNISKLRSKEEIALRQLREEASRIGVGVTREAQEVFNALSKTLPCHWSKDSIVVFDEIVISNPYGVDNCSGNDPIVLERVKKVLYGERRRIFKETK